MTKAIYSYQNGCVMRSRVVDSDGLVHVLDTYENPPLWLVIDVCQANASFAADVNGTLIVEID